MGNINNMFDYILLAMGLYVLVSGIRGKGKLYAADNIKEGMEEKYHKTMRALYIVLGVIMTINGGISVLKYSLYEYKEVASDAATVMYDWVLKADLGSFGFLTIPFFNILTYICLGLSIVCIVYMIIVIRKLTDKNAPAKRNAEAAAQQAQANRQAGHSLPVSAFEFDDAPEAAEATEALPTGDEPKAE